LFQNLVYPLTELDTTLALYTVTYGDDNVKVVKRLKKRSHLACCQPQMAELFQTDRTAIVRHINNIYKM
jgi:hypothetical protein